MKPALNMETKENITMKVEEGQTIRKNSSTKLKVIGVLGLSAMVLVAGAALLGIFVGKSMSKETYKEAWATYKDTETNVIIKERFILRDQTLTIIKPGEMTAIFDINKNHVVMQIDDWKSDDTEDCMCMLFDMDRFTSMTFEDVNAFLNQTYITVVQKLAFDYVELEHTGQDVDPTELSRMSLELCLGCKISRVNIQSIDDPNSGNRKKRKAGNLCDGLNKRCNSICNGRRGRERCLKVCKYRCVH